MDFKNWLTAESNRRQVIVEGQVVPDQHRCVQCGVCSFYCPIAIDVRRHAWMGVPIKDSHCLTCGECVARCPRGVLRLERSGIFLKLHSNINVISKEGKQILENG